MDDELEKQLIVSDTRCCCRFQSTQFKMFVVSVGKRSQLHTCTQNLLSVKLASKTTCAIYTVDSQISIKSNMINESDCSM
jgi:hypothetical protein